MRRFILFLTILIFTINNSSEACTVFSAARNGKVLTAKNQDYHIIHTRMLLIPPQGNKYGVIYFGDQNPEGFCNTSGMNDQGLWYAGASVPERSDIKNYYNKPTIQGELCEKALEECATVEEVIAMYKKYYSPHWNGHSLWTDRFGNSVVTEFGEDDVVFIRSHTDFQVATNFYLCDTTNAWWHQCYRYEVANYMLESSDDISVDLFRSICDATHAEGKGPTVLSTIHDLTTGDIYIYDFHNFDEVVKINLHEELKKGQQYYKIPEFFHQIKLRSPKSEEKVDPTSVTFEWNGNGKNYLLYYSTDPNMTTCQPIEIGKAQSVLEAKMSLLAFFMGMMLLSGILIKKKKAAVVIICLMIIVILFSCEMDILTPPATSRVKHSYIVENIQPNTTYYWKVVAVGENGINSESVVQSFVTKE
jgi:hypothetical protein